MEQTAISDTFYYVRGSNVRQVKTIANEQRLCSATLAARRVDRAPAIARRAYPSQRRSPNDTLTRTLITRSQQQRLPELVYQTRVM